MILKAALVGLVLLVDYALGSCGVCQENQVLCHSETTFSVCIGGTTSDIIITCPKNKVCSDQPSICVSKEDDSVMASCIMGCGICNPYTKLFACLSKTTFAFCFGEDEPFYASRTSCSDGFVCDLSSRSICVENNTISKPSCDEETDISTETTSNPLEPTEIYEQSSQDSTTTSARDVATFCSETATVGTFKAEGDTTCTKYYICVTYRGGYRGYAYTCDNPNYFNSETGWCQKALPDNC